MNENSCEMLRESPPSTSEAARLKLNNDDIEMEEDNDDPQDDSLWSIEDDTLFYAQGLMNHSAGKGKSVFVTWNENYLLNFVFKTSAKTRKTSLTKVRLTLPCQNQEREEIEDMLILEMNTLLYMKSGHVYYFSSVKSMHQVEWLSGVRCMSSCPHSKFSVIRLICDNERGKSGKQLFLEVYQDVPLLGKFPSGVEVLRHRYDISFDLENIFNCDWLDDRYTLLSLITYEENLEFLKQLLSTGNTFRSRAEKIELENNQEVHIFTVSGNIFLLIGAIHTESELQLSNPEIEDYNIQLLNTYASNIECIRIDCKRNLLIVLLQSGHMDIWYKSKKMFGAILHRQHQLSCFLHYDYRPKNNTFYFTAPEDVIEIQIITSNDSLEGECVVHETHKSICGMIACTWVESLQQLICLSVNNIFYRLCFERRKQQVNLQENETHFESLNKLYALTAKRVKDLMNRAQIVNELMKQPERLHQAIEEEFQKQQLLAIGSKHKILQRLYQSHIEYHVNIPEINYFPENCIVIRTTFANSSTSREQNSVYCLIFLTLRKNNDFLSSVINTPQWHLHISDQQHSLLLHVPSNILQKNICLIVQYSLENTHKMLPNLSINMLTFVNHCSSYISLNFKIILDANEKTYRHIFSHNVRNLSLFRNSECNIEYLLKEFNKSKNNKDDSEGIFKLKYCFKITKTELRNIFEKLYINSIAVDNAEFKLFFLHQHVLELQYDESKEILTICSKYPEALFYIKLYLIYNSKSSEDVRIDLNTSKDAHQKIMQYQCNVERLYGSLVSSDSMNTDSSTVSIHLENLRKVYLKLRTEFYETFI